MKAPLLQNVLIEWLTSADRQEAGKTCAPFIERILKIEPSGVVVVIEVTQRKGITRPSPYCRTLTEIHDAIDSCQAQILTTDPWLKKPSSNPQHNALRDAAWKAIQPIVELKTHMPGDALDAAIRSRAKDTPRSLLRRWLRKYWIGGQTINALLPDFRKCGAKGKSRQYSTKPGRKAKYQGLRGKHLTTADFKKMEQGLRFYNSSTRPSIKQAYERTIETHYHDHYQEKDDHFSPVLLPPAQCPSLHQFRYHLKKNLNLEESLIKRVGERKYNLRFRPVTGKHSVLGPGGHWAVDATRADVRVLSSINPNQALERPTVYLIIDYFSKLIAGLYVTLNDPSYRCASLAILNAVSPKEEFCKRYGLSITNDIWPAHGIPEAILADRGELAGPIAEPIIEGLRVRLDNTPPYRADLKAVVERMFRSLNEELLHSLPGRILKDQTRGDELPAMNARLTLHELTRLIAKWAIVHNNKPLPTEWLPSTGEDEPEPTPAGLWKWGLTHANASLRYFPEQELRIALLPKGKASVGRRGIAFKKVYYDSATARAEHWFVGTSNNAGRTECRYDPNDASAIYIPKGDGFEECAIIDSDHVAKGRAWAELDAFHRSQQQRKVEAAIPAAQLQAELNAEIQVFQELPKPPKALRRLQAKNTRAATRLEKAVLAGQAMLLPQSAPLALPPLGSASLREELKQRGLELLEKLD